MSDLKIDAVAKATAQLQEDVASLKKSVGKVSKEAEAEPKLKVGDTILINGKLYKLNCVGFDSVEQRSTILIDDIKDNKSALEEALAYDPNLFTLVSKTSNP